MFAVANYTIFVCKICIAEMLSANHLLSISKQLTLKEPPSLLVSKSYNCVDWLEFWYARICEGNNICKVFRKYFRD